jgi:alkyl sulfatase BDS1-like metallo-beta-lactamase superfamily hydrolase
MANHPYLAEFYGTVEWSVRSIFTGYLGWFDGNASNLFPLEPQQHHAKMIELAGGESKLLETLRQAAANGEHQWALTLADMLSFTESSSEANQIKASSLRQLAAAESNPNARHYFFTQAM